MTKDICGSEVAETDETELELCLGKESSIGSERGKWRQHHILSLWYNFSQGMMRRNSKKLNLCRLMETGSISRVYRGSSKMMCTVVLSLVLSDHGVYAE